MPKVSFELTSDGMGYSGIMLYSRYELTNNNPWNEAIKLETLPVFENEFPFDYKDLKKFIPREEKDNLVESIGKSFGIDDLKYDNFTERYFSGDFYINVFLDFSSVIFWENSIPLPNID